MKLTSMTMKLKRLLINLLLFPVFMGLSVEGDAGAGEGAAGDAGAGGTDDGGTGAGGGQPTPEELAAQEETRRAALTDEERQAEDDLAALNADAPETYADFKIPAELDSSKDILEKFIPVMKDTLNLSQPRAQALIDFYVKEILPATAAKGLEVWNAEVAGRQEAIAKDPVLGGDNLAATNATVARVASTFLNAEELQELTEFTSRFGDPPAWVKLVARIGAVIKEDSIITANNSGAPGAKSVADRIFG